MLKIVLFLLILTTCSSSNNTDGEIIHFRFNQIGFATNSNKSAIVLSNINLKGRIFYVYDAIGEIVVYSDKISLNKGKYADFNYSFSLDFSDLTETGKYYLKIEDSKSAVFEIKDNLFKDFPNYFLQFFKMQRCGYTNPISHKTCHVSDIAFQIKDSKEIPFKHDVTGGWHDAGDYTKFLNTTAFSTYMLLFSYEFNKEKFSFDYDKNGIPDILEEAKIGLDWLLRANVNNKQFITQIQTEKDQQVGWRLPENDVVGYDRPGFVGIGKNLIGIYVAALTIASRIWHEDLKYDEYSEKLLSTALTFYSLKKNVNDIDSTGTGFYFDNSYKGKLALAEIELYQKTKNQDYLVAAKSHALEVGIEPWWGWGNVANLAFYKIAKEDPNYIDLLRKSLIAFQEKSTTNVFGEGIDLFWGSNLNLLGIPLINILYQSLTNDDTYQQMAISHFDYILGKNPWGISFIFGKGKNSVKHLHHQVGFFNHENYIGAIAGGPVKKSVYGELKINYETEDNYNEFQSENAFFRDDRNDYISNEPTISANATAIFVFGNMK